MSSSDPILGYWYQDAATGAAFRIVAIDPENDSIDVQYVNGDIGEYDFAAWEDSACTPIEAPEDWSAPFGGVELDDLGYSDPDLHGLDREDITLDDFLDNA